MLSLVRAQAPALTKIFTQKNKLAEEIFSDKFMEDRTDAEKISLFQLAQKSFTSDVEFMRNVQERIDVNALQAQLLEGALSDTNTPQVDSEAKAVVVDLLAKMLNKKRITA